MADTTGTGEFSVGTEGVKARVDRGLLEFLFPGRVARLNATFRHHQDETAKLEAAGNLRRALVEKITRKIEVGDPLGSEDLALALWGSGQEQKVENLLGVLNRVTTHLQLPAPSADRTGRVSGQTSADWIFRWREAAESFSSPEMREVLARILAGEYRTPGKFSMRALALVRDMDRTVAEAFGKIIPFVFLRRRLPYSNWPVYAEYGVKYDDLLLLDDAGILDVNSQSFIQCAGLLELGDWVARTTCKEKSIRVHSLTLAGAELLSVNDVRMDQDVATKLAQWLRARLPDLEISKDVEPFQFVPWNDGDPLPQ